MRGFGSYGGYKKGIYDSPRVKWWRLIMIITWLYTAHLLSI
jgi:hypothetical protein